MTVVVVVVVVVAAVVAAVVVFIVIVVEDVNVLIDITTCNEAIVIGSRGLLLVAFTRISRTMYIWRSATEALHLRPIKTQMNYCYSTTITIKNYYYYYYCYCYCFDRIAIASILLLLIMFARNLSHEDEG